MNIEILKEQEAPLLSRKRVTFGLVSDKETPSRKNLLKAVAEKTKAKPELIIIKHVYNKYGSKDVKVIAHIYKNKEDMKNIEGEYLLKKNSLEEPKKEEEAQ
ncbi:MAG: 30S ribosomal protein S24e [Nanoarchaeota archaeon]